MSSDKKWDEIIFFHSSPCKTKIYKDSLKKDGYKKQLREALEVIQDNDEKTAKKVALLKKFSDELASNIFFDGNEIHEIILELSKED